MKLLYTFFGWILAAIYGVVGNYGWAIVIFALVAKLITLPLTIKQTRSSQMMQVINPEVQKMQEKYKNNKNKQAEETMKIYDKYGYSPFSGCLPLLIQLPIIIGLFGVIRMPETYVFQNIGMVNISMGFYWVENLGVSAMDIAKKFGFTNINTYVAMILPALTVLTMWWQQMQMAKSNPAAQSMGMMNTMMLVMIGYSSVLFNAGLTLYWVSQTVFTVAQTWLIEKFVPVDIEKALAKGEKKKQKREAK